jgi:protein tyrosine phosphatase (PTP) superfamily phosphohydrolase (DUF442 family)
MAAAPGPWWQTGAAAMSAPRASEVTMKNIRSAFTGLLFLVLIPAGLCAQAAPQAQEKPRPPLPNYVELTAKIGTGGQPGEGGLSQLTEKGYTAIINIRAFDEEYDQVGEEKQARQLGLRYYVVPFVAKQPGEPQALAFNTLLSALKDVKVFVHCGSGNRVGSLMMIYLVLEEGMPLDKAELEARRAGLRSADLLEFSKQVISRHKK